MLSEVSPDLEPTAAAEWTVSDVVAWARKVNLSDDSVQALLENQVDGSTLITLDRAEIQNELGIRSLGARRYLWDLIKSLRIEQTTKDFIIAVELHKDEIVSLENNLDLENPDRASGGKPLDAFVANYLLEDAGSQRQIVQDHLLALKLQRELAGSQEDYEYAEYARAEQHRLQQLAIQSEFDHRYAATLEGRREGTVPDDQTIRDPTLFGMCVDAYALNRINVAEALRTRANVSNEGNSFQATSIASTTASLQRDEVALISDDEAEAEPMTIGELRLIKQCSVCSDKAISFNRRVPLYAVAAKAFACNARRPLIMGGPVTKIKQLCTDQTSWCWR
ncbi:hypothetical protein MPSEU_000935400 [Mayamaea pseudoterrestris]|nr:hypothetical protein MPSEU_000935400 [Mayamaea pseudoterrestris]